MDKPSVYELALNLQLADRSERFVRNEIRTALAEAVRDAKDDYSVKAEVEVKGAFLGVGETALILTITHLLKVGTVTAVTGGIAGAGSEVGKAFVKSYLIPRLRAHGILPGEPKEIISLGPTDSTDTEG